MEAKVVKTYNRITIYVRNTLVSEEWGVSEIFEINDFKVSDQLFYALFELQTFGYSVQYEFCLEGMAV